MVAEQLLLPLAVPVGWLSLGQLLVQEEHGDVVLVEASPERWNAVARFPALAEDTWSNPCLYGRYLLLRSAGQACCYELTLLN